MTIWITSNKIKMRMVAVVIIAIALLLFDFLITDEFKIEGKYLIIVLPVFLGAIITSLFKSPTWLFKTIGSLIIIITAYQFYILLIFGWGYGFLGARVPTIWICAVALNAILCMQYIGMLILKNKNA